MLKVLRSGKGLADDFCRLGIKASDDPLRALAEVPFWSDGIAVTTR
jgi:hypothetical protein